MDDKQVTVMVLIDLSKAFDSISHSSLLSKLRNFGTSESALRWFESGEATNNADWNIIVTSVDCHPRCATGFNTGPSPLHTIHERPANSDEILRR